MYDHTFDSNGRQIKISTKMGTLEGPRGVGVASTSWNSTLGLLTIVYTDASTETLSFQAFRTEIQDAQTATAADAVSTNADAIATAADAVSTNADAIATAADRVQTGLDATATAADAVSTNADAIATAADAVSTNADAVATAADRVQTGLDATATAADAVSTNADALATAADAVSTNADAIATAADAVSTNADALATAADRVQTGLDAAATAADAVNTAADRVQTGLDVASIGADVISTADDAAATAADRVQTGLDATATGADASATAADRVQTGLDAAATSADAVSTSADAVATAADAAATAADRVQTGLDAVSTAADASAAAVSQIGAASSQALTAASEIRTEQARDEAISQAATIAAREDTATAQAAIATAQAVLADASASESAGSAATAKVWADSALAVSGNSAAAYVASLPYTTAPVALDIAPCGVPEHIRLGWGLSWASEEVHTGPQLGMFANETLARAHPDAVTGAIYESLTGQFYKLSAGSGTTEVFRGDQAAMPRTLITVTHGVRVVIRNGDKPGAPMWRVFVGRYANMVALGSGYNFNSAKFHSGCLYTAAADGARSGMNVVNFTADQGHHIGVTNTVNAVAHGSARYAGNIAQSELELGNVYDPSIGVIPSTRVNDLAVTVLPDAPYVNGVQVPTVAVALGLNGQAGGGVSILHNDGTVVTQAAGAGAGGYASFQVEFDQRNRLVATHSWGGGQYPTLHIFNELPTENVAINGSWLSQQYVAETIPSFSPVQESASSFLRILTALKGTSLLARASDPASAVILVDDPTDRSKGMVRHITGGTGAYDTGMMVGDIRACLMSSTDATSLGGIFAPLATYDANWTDNADGSFTSNASNNGNLKFNISGFAVNDWIEIIFTIDEHVSGAGIQVANATGALGYVSAPGNYRFVGKLQFIGASHLWLQANAWVGTVSGVAVRLLDTDRSGKGNHAIVHGTLPRTPVATGSDLVGYSGFSASDYLEVPYDADFDFGTGDFCVMGWVKLSSTTVGYLIDTRNNAGNGVVITTSTSYSFGLNAGSSAAGGATSIGQWCLVSAYRQSGVLYLNVNAAMVASQANTNPTFNGASTVSIGKRGGLASGSLDGSLALLRIGATVPSDEQIARIYEVERKLFYPNAKCKLLGATVNAVERDPILNQYLVLTSGGLVTMDQWGSIISTDAALAGKTKIAQRDGLRVVN